MIGAIVAFALIGQATAAPATQPAQPPAARVINDQPITISPTPRDWRPLDAENTLVIDTNRGRILVEMTPLAAPRHVERIKVLARRGFFDNIVFHRVIDWFMAQTGDPLGTGEGQSPYPDLEAEFTFRRGPTDQFAQFGAPAGAAVGFIGSLPVMSQPDALMARGADGKVSAWALYCPGVAGMARDEAPNSANSQFFLMRQPYPSLEKRYTVWGRVVHGLDVVRAIKTGEPVVDPDRMTRVRVMADMPEAEQPAIQVVDTRGPAFRQTVERIRQGRGADFSLCDVEIATRPIAAPASAAAPAG